MINTVRLASALVCAATALVAVSCSANDTTNPSHQTTETTKIASQLSSFEPYSPEGPPLPDVPSSGTDCQVVDWLFSTNGRLDDQRRQATDVNGGVRPNEDQQAQNILTTVQTEDEKNKNMDTAVTKVSDAALRQALVDWAAGNKDLTKVNWHRITIDSGGQPRLAVPFTQSPDSPEDISLGQQGKVLTDKAKQQLHASCPNVNLKPGGLTPSAR